MEENKKRNVLIIIVAIIGMLLAFGCGYVLSVSLTPATKCKDAPQTEEKKEEEKPTETDEEKKEVPVRDTFAINLMSGYVYVLNNGELYYLEPDLLDDGGISRYFLLTHSGCLADNSSDYCKTNPVYSKKAVKVNVEGSVTRVKTFNKKGATDESFSVYAILEDGSVYLINKTTATKVESLENVDDMLSQKIDKIDVLLKDGTHKNY